MVGRIHLQRILSSWGKNVIADKTRKEKDPQQAKKLEGEELEGEELKGEELKGGGDNYKLLQLKWIIISTYNEDWERGRDQAWGGVVCYFPNTTRSKVPAGDQK